MNTGDITIVSNEERGAQESRGEIYEATPTKIMTHHISLSKLVNYLILIIFFLIFIILPDISYSEDTGKSEIQELKPSTTLPSGTVTVDSLEIEPAIQAYNSVADAIEVIIKRLESKIINNKIILITKENMLLDCLLYKQVLYLLNTTDANMKYLYNKIKKRDQPNPTSVFLGTVPGFLLESVNKILCAADFWGLFKTDIILKGKAVSIDEFALTNLAAKKLIDKGIYNVYDSSFIALEPINFSYDDDPLKEALNNCYNHKKDLEDLKVELKEKSEKETNKVDKERILSNIKEIEDTDNRFDKFIDNFEKPGDNGITPPFKAFITHYNASYETRLFFIFKGNICWWNDEDDQIII